MPSEFRHTLKALPLTVAVAAICTAQGAQAQTAEGTEVANRANVTYTVGGTTINLPTNDAVFTVRAPRPKPTIEFFRFSPNAPDPLSIKINGSDYSPSGQLDGPFVTIGPAVRNTNRTGRQTKTNTTETEVLDLSEPLPLIPAYTYLSGELMFLRVQYDAPGLNPNEIDTVAITVEADNGDSIVLQLYEESTDSKAFWAYMPSTRDATAPNDPFMTTANNTELQAIFVDTGSAVEAVVDSALVNPGNTVFDSVTGAPIDGAVVTLMDLDTGQPAEVFGVDGFSTYPSTVTTGQIVSDASGLQYFTDEGFFSFPVVRPGNYAITVEAPDGYTFSSAVSPQDLSLGKGSDYLVIDASYGKNFDVSDIAPLRFDVPLDPRSELTLTKVVDRAEAAVGDFVGYTVTVSNRGEATVPLNMADMLPLGFRYVQGTARLENAATADPAVSDGGTMLTFPMGTLAPGRTVNISYALEVGPGAVLGDAINEAVMRDFNGVAASNIGRAAVAIREDLFRSTSTVVGRITEQSCDGDQDWVRPIETGIGVEGVRIYTETGAYAVSDQDGLYHFEGVSEGTHVVQVDKETLPQGYELMTCEENSRYAGNNFSKFVDVKGGGIWRANFYLKQTGEKAVEAEEEVVSTTKEYQEYDQAWLDAQTSEPEWVYPKLTPSVASTHIGIKYPADGSVELFADGRPVARENLVSRDTSADQRVKIARWRGVDLREGTTEFMAIIRDADGHEIDTVRRSVSYVTNIARAHAVPGQSVLVADGRTVPSLAIRLEDEAGRPVHAGRAVNIELEAPFKLFNETAEKRLEEQTPDLVSPFSASRSIAVGSDGILNLKLEPTLRTGKVTAQVTLDTGRIVPITMFLEPEKRDWIVVGLAEGSAGYETVKDKAISLTDTENDTVTDGRLAFFAKGLIKGNWLMTLAVDTDKRRGKADGAFQDEIDPNAYYTLYGDRSYQDYEARSRYPVYVKLEKKTAYALFGDFDTNIQEGKLTAYNRKLSGLKAEYVGEKLQVTGFAAETNQGFGKDEIAANGTSGSYKLGNGKIIPQSETIVIETRDRDRPDEIINRRTMVRYLDYTLDYLTGDLIFRLPVDATDFDFNPNVIVAEYETSEEAERNVTFGGRVQADLAEGRVRIGSTAVSENGSSLTRGSKQVMVGVDAVARITDGTELRVEYAVTEDRSTPGADQKDAKLIELVHTGEKVSADAFYREEEGGFGLNQTDSNTQGVRRYGVNARVRVSDKLNEETGHRTQVTVDGKAWHEDNLDTGASRDSAEVSVRRSGRTISAAAGLRAAKDSFTDRAGRESVLATMQASVSMPEHGAVFTVAHEQPIGGKDAVSAMPQRTVLGADKTLFGKATAHMRHEILKGATTDSQNTTLGLSVAPWRGSEITMSSDLLTQDSSRRLGGTIGLDQQIRINDNWSASAGVRDRRILDESGDYVEVAPDAAVAPTESNQNFTSAYMGVGYRNDVMSASGRLEGRSASDGDTWIASASAARELSQELSLAGAVRAQMKESPTEATNTHRVDARLGVAWRPRDEGTIVYNRFDFSTDTDTDGMTKTKLVSNTAVNHMISDRWQLSGHYGIKHVRDEIFGKVLKSTNQLVGGETRFDITEKIDIGLQGSALFNDKGEVSYSYGPSVGLSPAKNVWISAGYNVEGFSDDDFEAAEYSRSGPYVKLRVKFDQNTAHELLRRISPRSQNE